MLTQISYLDGDAYPAIGFGADNNGLALQPSPRPDAAERPFRYPFKSYDGRVTFEQQVTGNRHFDINTDGVAHYGLYPDFFADLQQQDGGDKVMQYFFRSAEAYLRMWERAYTARQQP